MRAFFLAVTLVLLTVLTGSAMAQDQTAAPYFYCGKTFITVELTGGNIASFRKSDIRRVFWSYDQGGEQAASILLQSGENESFVGFVRNNWSNVVTCLD